jgi:hypothetical protein
MHHNLVGRRTVERRRGRRPAQYLHRKRGGPATAMEERIGRTRALAELSVVGRGVGVDVALTIADVQRLGWWLRSISRARTAAR